MRGLMEGVEEHYGGDSWEHKRKMQSQVQERKENW